MTKSEGISYVVTAITGLVYATVVLFVSLNSPWFESLPPDVARALFLVAHNSAIPFFALVIFYLLYAALSGVVPPSKRWLWFWLIFFGHFVVIPFFWYYYFCEATMMRKASETAT